MDRSESIGLAVALIGHVAVLGLLSATFLAKPDPVKPPPPPSVDVSLVDEVGLTAAAPQAAEPPAPSQAPDVGAPEDAAPPPDAAVREADPTPPARPKPAPAAKPDAAKPAPPKPTKPVPAPGKPAAKPATGKTETAPKPRPRGSRLSDDLLAGLGDEPSPSKSIAPRAAVIDAKALAGIQDAIRRQIQPCADRQVNPGPGANEIVTVFNLRLNRDGTLAATPSVIRQSGADGEAARYSRRVIDLGVAALKGCSPLRLPPEFYQTPAGGWNNINYNWQLR